MNYNVTCIKNVVSLELRRKIILNIQNLLCLIGTLLTITRYILFWLFHFKILIIILIYDYSNALTFLLIHKPFVQFTCSIPLDACENSIVLNEM